jgi:HAE1 family hydrophobic/amphiphilic exporter-1
MDGTGGTGDRGTDRVAVYQRAKGFFPQEDIGQLTVNIDTPQDMSYDGRLVVAQQLGKTLVADPAVSAMLTKVDHDTTQLVLTLKDQSQRPPMAQVIAQMRAETQYLPGITPFFSAVQNLKVGGRSAKSSYQYTLQSVNSGDGLSLNDWANKLMDGMKKTGVFVGINSDAQLNGLQADLQIDRNKASLMGVDIDQIRSNLYAAFGTQQVSTIYAPEDSYQVIMEVNNAFRQNESDLSKIYVRSSANTLLPVTTFTHVTRSQGSRRSTTRGSFRPLRFRSIWRRVNRCRTPRAPLIRCSRISRCRVRCLAAMPGKRRCTSSPRAAKSG